MADTAPPFPSKIFLSGDAVDIAVYVDADGESPAWEFVKGLPAAGRAKFTSLCEFLAAQGRIANPSSFKHEKNGIFGFKLPNQDRVACFQDGRTWVCTHGLRKNGKWRESDFARAERIRDDYRERKAEVLKRKR